MADHFFSSFRPIRRRLREEDPFFYSGNDERTFYDIDDPEDSLSVAVSEKFVNIVAAVTCLRVCMCIL
jgi:hypothetical protein